ncbi:MAG TPA: hypothetical protein VIT42_19345 [Microlunatus sp.]
MAAPSETFSGVLIPFAGSTLAPTCAGFVAMNEALAQEITSIRGPRQR